ncbi:hypothetical protein HGRIS_004343 [Hohenbuehelia grisea]
MAFRSPVCKTRKGGFKDTKADELIAGIVQALRLRTLDPALVNDIAVSTVMICTMRVQKHWQQASPVPPVCKSSTHFARVVSWQLSPTWAVLSRAPTSPRRTARSRW